MQDAAGAVSEAGPRSTTGWSPAVVAALVADPLTSPDRSEMLFIWFSLAYRGVPACGALITREARDGSLCRQPPSTPHTA